jgi:hypothetical protein
MGLQNRPHLLQGSHWLPQLLALVLLPLQGHGQVLLSLPAPLHAAACAYEQSPILFRPLLLLVLLREVPAVPAVQSAAAASVPLQLVQHAAAAAAAAPKMAQLVVQALGRPRAHAALLLRAESMLQGWEDC